MGIVFSYGMNNCCENETYEDIIINAFLNNNNSVIIMASSNKIG